MSTPSRSPCCGMAPQPLTRDGGVIKYRCTKCGEEFDVPREPETTPAPEPTPEPEPDPEPVEGTGLEGLTKDELYELAQDRDLSGRSTMTRDELLDALAE